MRGLVLIAGVLATSRPAWARYDPCGHLSVLEPAGPVPRNAKIWLWRGGGEGGDRLRIRGPGADRAVAPPFARPFLGSSRGLGAFDPGLLAGDETYRLAIVGDRPAHAWTLAELATGSAVDHRPPPPPRFHALAITQRLDPRDPLDPRGPHDLAEWNGFDLPASDIATALELSDDTVALEVTFDDSTERYLVPRDDPGMLGHSRCGPGRRFAVGARVCMSIRAIDLAGNHSDAATRCTTVGGRIGDAARTARPPAWPARSRRPAPPGPAGWLALAALAALAAWAGSGRGWQAPAALARRPDPG